LIRQEFFDETFFKYYPIIQDIDSGKLTDVAPYKKLGFIEANIKYEKRQYFEGSTPIKVYPNGFKWIDTGRKSVLLAEQMRNCGSAGLMSQDENRTILALFGPNNKPHVMLTYSPNEKRISGDECTGSSPVKPEYHEYVMDLAHQLGVRFDTERTKSPLLKVKYLLRNKAQQVESLQSEDHHFYDQYYRFVADGQMYYTNGYDVVSKTDVDRIQDMVESGELELSKVGNSFLGTVFYHYNRGILDHSGFKFTPLKMFAGEQH
jgi:hypothetical protein